MMTLVGIGAATVSAQSLSGQGVISKPGRFQVMRLTDPTDAAADVVGSICIAHERGREGISFSPADARQLAALLIEAATRCDEMIAAKTKASS